MLDKIKVLFKEGLEYTHTAGLLQQIANIVNIVNAQYMKDADGKNAHKRWPEQYDGGPVGSDDFQFEPQLIAKDICERVLKQGVKPKKDAAPLKREPKRDKKVKVADVVAEPFKIKNIQERIESLVYYGTGDEGYELFQQTCALCYSLFGLGANGKAEIACAWAEEMAHESRAWAEDYPDDTAKGYWGR